MEQIASRNGGNRNDLNVWLLDNTKRDHLCEVDDLDTSFLDAERAGVLFGEDGNGDATVKLVVGADEQQGSGFPSSVSSKNKHSSFHKRQEECSSSSKRKMNELHELQEAEIYQKRKEVGFRDLGLLAHIEDCQETRAALKTVGDPEVLRKKKIEDFMEEFKRTKPRGTNTHGISEYEVKERLQSLKEVSVCPRKNKQDLLQAGSGQPIIEEMKSKLRPASSSSDNSRPSVGTVSKKKWTPKRAAGGAASDVAYSPSPMQTMFGNMGKKEKRRCTAHRIPHLEPVAISCAIKMSTQQVEEQEHKEDGPPPTTAAGDVVMTQQAETENDDDDDDVPTNQFKMQRAKLRSTRTHQASQLKKSHDYGDGRRNQQEVISTTTSRSSSRKEEEEEEEASSRYKEMRQMLKPTATLLQPQHEKLQPDSGRTSIKLENDHGVVITASAVLQEEEPGQEQVNNPLLPLKADTRHVARQEQDCHYSFCCGNDNDDDKGCGVVFLARFLPRMLFRRKESMIV